MKKILLTLALLWSISAFADPIKKIVLFGDSLTDNGNFYTFVKDKTGMQFPKSPPYGGDVGTRYPGRFTNGAAWSDTMEVFFKQKFNIESINYAVGGASVKLLNPFQKNLPWIVDFEVVDYIKNTAFQNRDDVLFILWAGANDYTGNRDNVGQATTDVVNSLMATINRLINLHGARNFLVFNLPDLSRIPRAKIPPIDADNLHQLSIAHNAKLAVALDKLKSSRKDIRVAAIDVFEVFNELVDNPEKYNKLYNKNFKNVTESCWKGGYALQQNGQDTVAQISKELQKTLGANKNNVDTKQLAEYIAGSPDLAVAYRTGQLYGLGIEPCKNADEYAFWDEVHPTAPVHDVIAQIAIQKIIDAGFLK